MYRKLALPKNDDASNFGSEPITFLSKDSSFSIIQSEDHQRKRFGNAMRKDMIYGRPEDKLIVEEAEEIVEHVERYDTKNNNSVR